MRTRLLISVLASGVFVGVAASGAHAQSTRVTITPGGHTQLSWAPPGAKPVIAQPWCAPCPGPREVWIRATVESDKPVQAVSHDITANWSTNLPLNNQPFTAKLQPNPLDARQSRMQVRARCNDQAQNVSRTLNGNAAVVDFNWSHTPFQETFHLTGSVTVSFSDGTPSTTIPIDQKVELYFHGCGQSGAPPCAPGGAPGGTTLTAGNYVFIWKAPNSLIWQNSPKGELVVDTNVPSLKAVKAVAAGTGPVVIYETSGSVRYKMYDGFSADEVASGEVGRGALVNAEFIPMPYGAKALVTVREGQQAAYYMFTIDQWGKAGTTRQVGSKLSTNKAHWTVQYRSVFYLFEFDPANGTLTVKDNYKGWSATIDSGITGLIVPAGTGGGPVVVYEKQKAVYGALVHWESGALKERLALGNGTLLQASFTLRGSYGANGTALIQTSPTSADNVPFTLDLWGDVGSTGVKTKTPWPAGSPLPPVPSPGFPGGGMSASPPAGCDESDCDRDGFSDEFERQAGTNPSLDTSKPTIAQSIVLLLDASGSMSNNNKMEDAKKAAIAALSNLNPTTEIAVMSYEGGCDTRFPVVACFSQDPAYLSKQIQSIQTGGSTPMSPALLQAREYLWKKSHGRQGRIILLCDGQNDCRPPEPTEAAQKIFQRIISSNMAEPPGTSCGPPSLAGLLRSAFPVLQAAPPAVGVPDLRQAPPQDPSAAGGAQPGPLRTSPGTGQGGPDDIPPGAAPMTAMPGDELPPDLFMGSPAVIPPGAVPPARIDPVPYVDPYGTVGLDTSASGGTFGVQAQMPIMVSTIGFGLQGNQPAQQALAAVAQAGGGQNFDAANLAQLTSAFSQAIVGTGGGGGGGGGAVIPSGGFADPTTIVLFLLLAGSLVLVVAIVVVRNRGAAAVRLRLRVVDARGASRVVEVTDGSITIGRGTQNRLVLDDPEVSAVHAVIEVTAQGMAVRDLGSANGTAVNGQRVAEAALATGDEIAIGTTRIVING